MKYYTYWANTSGNRLVKKLLREGNSEIKEQLSDLMEGKVLRVPVDEQIVYNQLDMRQDAIWSLLLASGYLKVIRYDRLDLLERGEEGLKDTIQSALKQIEEKQYEATLIAKGINKDKIVKYGFAFEGKKF